MHDESTEAPAPATISIPIPTAFRTSLKLDERQLRRLVDHVTTRLEDVCKEMGRGKDGLTVTGSWLDKRRINQMWYEGDLTWRENDLALGGIFHDSNFTRGDGKRYVRHMAAKITDDLLGTSPFFAAMKKPAAGEARRTSLVQAIEDVAQEGVEGSNVPDTLREAVELALVRNEAVVKVRNVFDATGYVGPAEVLVDEAGQPVRTPRKGLYVYRNDDLLPLGGGDATQGMTYRPGSSPPPPSSSSSSANKQSRAAAAWGSQNDGGEERSAALSAGPLPSPSAEPIPSPVRRLALEKDASFIVTEEEAAEFQYRIFDHLPQVRVHKQGLEARVLDPRDFICPLKVNDIHDADLCAHLYDESPMVLKQVYGAFDVSGGYFCAPESGEKAPIAIQGEQPGSGLSSQQWVPVAEVYVRFDADEDGREEHILLVLDRDRHGGTALFYDYLHNHMKKRPFEVLHGLRKVASRWYGMGVYTDKFDQLLFVDKTFNRINLKSSKTCTVTAVRREAIEEWSDHKVPISFGGDELLTLTNKWSDDRGEFIRQVRLIEVNQEETALMGTMLQAMDQEFGYISAADASATGLNQSRTATGIASIERSGNNIVKAVERVQRCGIEAVLVQAVDILLENMDAQRLALTKRAELLTLNREEIRDLPREVKLLLTRSRSSELLATNQQAVAIANDFFDKLSADPRRARALRPMYLGQLKALEVQDADEILAEVTDEMVEAWDQARQQPAEQAGRNPISIAYRDLQPSEKAQALMKIGIKPQEGEFLATEESTPPTSHL